MKIAIAVLTWNRFDALKNFCDGIEKHCRQYQFAIFEDAGTKDDTVGFVLKAARLENYQQRDRPELDALEIKTLDNTWMFLGRHNLGVAGNTNRALRWFMEDTDADFLCLCNDDLVIKGDFAALYAQVAEATGIGLFCFCGFKTPGYECRPVEWNGHKLKVLSRLTGAMMAMSRKLVADIGYFDLRFGKFGEEHCDYTSRSYHRSFHQLGTHNPVAWDIEHDLLEHADVESTMQGQEREAADTTAANAIRTINYARDGIYRPFQLRLPAKVAGVNGEGVREDQFAGTWHMGLKAHVVY